MDPQSQNAYAYARNNPVTLIDPTGLWNAKTGEVEDGDTLGQITQHINDIYGTSYSYQQIAEMNKISDPNKITVGQFIFPNAYNPVITDTLNDEMQSHAKNLLIQNPLYFAWQEREGGKWDLKSQEGMFCTREACGGLKYEGYVYETQWLETDAPGNIHYGYVGNSAWFGSRTVLQTFSSIVNAITYKTLKPERKEDKINIDFGIHLRRNK